MKEQKPKEKKMYRNIFTVQTRTGIKIYKHTISNEEASGKTLKEMQKTMNDMVFNTSKLIGHDGGLLGQKPQGNVYFMDDKLGEVAVDITELVGITSKVIKVK